MAYFDSIPRDHLHRMDSQRMDSHRMDSHRIDIESILSKIESSIEPKFNMYERQIDQLFDFSYRSQDDIKILFKRVDGLDSVKSQINNSHIVELNHCVKGYYNLELENKKRMEWIECYQLQLFICQLLIIIYLFIQWITPTI
jgi:hypothetical protein